MSVLSLVVKMLIGILLREGSGGRGRAAAAAFLRGPCERTPQSTTLNTSANRQRFPQTPTRRVLVSCRETPPCSPAALLTRRFARHAELPTGRRVPGSSRCAPPR